MKRIALLALLLQVGFANCGGPEEPMAGDMQGPPDVTLPSGDAIKAFYANSCETLSPSAQKILEGMAGLKMSFAVANRLKKVILDFHNAEKPLEVNAELFDHESVAARKKFYAELDNLVAPILFDEEESA